MVIIGAQSCAHTIRNQLDEVTETSHSNKVEAYAWRTWMRQNHFEMYELVNEEVAISLCKLFLNSDVYAADIKANKIWLSHCVCHI